MNISITPVKEADKILLNSMLEQYENEPNDYEDEEQKPGPYVYKHLDRYFTWENWLAYFIMADGTIAGFALISPDSVEGIPTDYALYEFYVLPEFRRRGVGKVAACKIFDMHKGKWMLQRDPRDKNSVPFWNAVIAEYTGGDFMLLESSEKSIAYSGGVLGDIFVFESGTWQINAAKEMTKFIHSLYDVKKIDKTGSILDQSLLDIFSDVDMNIFLQDSVNFNAKEFTRALAGKFNIFGYQIHSPPNHDLLRICLENGRRFDLSFFHTKDKTPLHMECFEDKIDSVINEFWFTAAMVLAKHGRGDYLVAYHLVLELCQHIIVVQMLARDRAKGTDFHRFGDKEAVPVFDGLLGLNESATIIDMLFMAAEHMDKTSELLNLGYTSRTDKLMAIQQGAFECKP